MAGAADENPESPLQDNPLNDNPLNDNPLNDQVVAAVEEANEALRKGSAEDGQSLIRLQIAHSLSLALADAVAQTRRLQTLALTGQAAAQRRMLNGGDPELAQYTSDLGHRAVEHSTRDVLELARSALEIFEGSPKSEAKKSARKRKK